MTINYLYNKTNKMKTFSCTLVLLAVISFLNSDAVHSALLTGLVVGESKDGVIVLDVKQNLAVVEAGIKNNDIIVEIDGKKINTGVDYVNVTGEINERKEINILIKRDVGLLTVVIKPYDISPIVGSNLQLELDEQGSYTFKQTPIIEADTFFKDGMMFMKEGLREEAIDNFKIATSIYEKALSEKNLSEKELAIIRENLNEMNKQFDFPIEKAVVTEEKAVVAEEPSVAAGEEKAEKKEIEARIAEKETQTETQPETKTEKKEIEEIEEIIEEIKSEDASESLVEIVEKEPVKVEISESTTTELTSDAAPTKTEQDTGASQKQIIPVNKTDLKEAEKGEYWVIESTTILLKKPDLSGNEISLLNNLIGGLPSGTLVEVMEIEGTSASKWIKVNVYNKKDEVYVKGWLRSFMVGKASQVQR